MLCGGSCSELARSKVTRQCYHVVLDSMNGRYGIGIKGGSDSNHPILISRIQPQTPAACCEKIKLGHEITHINCIPLKNATHNQVLSIIKASPRKLELIINPRRSQLQVTSPLQKHHHHSPMRKPVPPKRNSSTHLDISLNAHQHCGRSQANQVNHHGESAHNTRTTNEVSFQFAKNNSTSLIVASDLLSESVVDDDDTNRTIAGDLTSESVVDDLPNASQSAVDFSMTNFSNSDVSKHVVFSTPCHQPVSNNANQESHIFKRHSNDMLERGHYVCALIITISNSFCSYIMLVLLLFVLSSSWFPQCSHANISCLN